MELYRIQRQLLINLSKLDWQNMKDIMQLKLERQIDGTEWSFENINSLCWAIGSISGTLPEHEEKTFLIATIRVKKINQIYF
jgi:exportin-1